VDDSLFISQEKTYNITLPELYSSYRVVIDLMVMFGLVMEHDKSEISHFFRMLNNSNPELNLSPIGVPCYISNSANLLRLYTEFSLLQI